MPGDANGAIRGSVIQRTLIPEGLTAVLSVATVPVSELCTEEDLHEFGFSGLVADVLGVAEESILDEDDYAELESRLRRGDPGDFGLPHPFWQEMLYFWTRQYLRPEREIQPLGGHAAGLLATHALALMVRPQGLSTASFPPMPWTPEVARSSRGDGIAEENFDLAMRCFVASRSANERVTTFIEHVGEYDVPSGQSPATASDTLQKVIAGSSKACLAPLAVGGSAALAQLGQGAFVNALLFTGTGAAMTLVLVGTVTVADLLVQHMRHRRDRIHRRPPKKRPHLMP